MDSDYLLNFINYSFNLGLHNGIIVFFALLLASPFFKICIALSSIKIGLGSRDIIGFGLIGLLSFVISLYAIYPKYNEIAKKCSDCCKQIDSAQKFSTEFNLLTEELAKFIKPRISPNELDRFTKQEIVNLSKNPNFDQNSYIASYRVLMVAYLVSELKLSFIYALKIIIPFVIIDFVVLIVFASFELQSISPVVFSLPLKLAVFLIADGWRLIIESLIIGISSGVS